MFDVVPLGLLLAICLALPGLANDGIDIQVKIEIIPSRPTLWVDDIVDVTLRVAIRLPDGLTATIEPLTGERPPHLEIPYLATDALPGLQGPDVRALLQPWLTRDGRRPAFTINDFTLDTGPWGSLFHGAGMQPQPARFLLDRQFIDRNGQRWVEYVIRTPWKAEREGLYTFGPVRFKGPVAVAIDPRSRAARWQDISAVGAAAMVRVVPPPAEDRPATFFGAVGTRMSASLAIEPQTCRLGDPVTMRLQFLGDMRTDRMRPPRLGAYEALSSLFSIQEETLRTVRTDGGIEFRATLRPLVEGAHEIPAIEWPWFDRETQRYRTAVNPPVPLHILPARRLQWHEILKAAHPDALAADRADPVPAAFRADPDGWRTRSWRHERATLRWAAAGPILYLLVVIASRLPAGLRSMRRYRRRKRAPTNLCRRLQCLARKTNDPLPETAHAVRSAFDHFFADAFDIRTASKTPSELWPLLSEHAPMIRVTPVFRDLLERCHHQAYAGQPEASFHPQRDIDLLIKEMTTVNAPSSIADRDRDAGHNTPSHEQRHRGLRGLPVAPITACLLAVILLTTGRPQTLSPADTRVRQSLWMEANALAATAIEPDQFQAARDRYHELIAAGARTGALAYNLGTLYLEMNALDAAIDILRDAGRIEGNQPDVDHNLRLAWQRAAAVAQTDPDTPPPRIAWLLPNRVAAATRRQMAATLFALAWLAGALHHLKGLGVEDHDPCGPAVQKTNHSFRYFVVK